MDSDDNADLGAEIGLSGPEVEDETVERATERRFTEEEEDLRESLTGLSRLAAPPMPCGPFRAPTAPA